jgi:hypothetical protein
MSQYRLQSGTKQSGFSPLLEDLNFIKTHRRYPINKHTIYVAVAGLGSIFTGIALLCLFLLLGWESPGRYWIVPFIFTLTLLQRAAATISLLRFRQLKNQENTTGNIALLKEFLLHHQLAYFQSPLAPEVFQIASRELGTGAGQREILVFIADEGRILLNSHFTNAVREGIPLKISSEYRKMEKALRKWIKERTVEGPEGFFRKIGN